MNKTKLSPYDWDMCAMIESITGQTVSIQLIFEYIKISWIQESENGETIEESLRVKALKDAIQGRLGKRFKWFGYEGKNQSVSFEYDPVEYPEETRYELMNPEQLPKTQYKSKNKEVNAVLFFRENIEEVNAFTGGGILTIPSKINETCTAKSPDMRATFTFPNKMGLLVEVKEGNYIINDDGNFTSQNKKAFEKEFKPNFNL